MSRHRSRSEVELLRQTAYGRRLVRAWWLLLVQVVCASITLIPFIVAGWGAVPELTTTRTEAVAAIALAAILVFELVRTAGVAILLGFVPQGIGFALLVFVVAPAIAGGAWPPAATVEAALVMTFATISATYGRRAVAIAGVVSLAITMMAASMMAWAVGTLIGVGDSFWIAAAVLSTFGALSDVAVTQVSSVLVAARRPGATLAQARADALFVGRDHLKTMIHTLWLPVLVPVVLSDSQEVGLGLELLTVLIGAWAMSLVTSHVTRLTCRALEGMSKESLDALEAEDH